MKRAVLDVERMRAAYNECCRYMIGRLRGAGTYRHYTGNRLRYGGGEGYVRFSYADSFENIREALDRLNRFLLSRGFL